MIERKDILSIPYLKKTSFTGSYEGLRFRFQAVKREVSSKEGEETDKKECQVLEVAAWEAPYSFDKTLEENIQKMETDFSEEGIQKGIDWLNGLWEKEPKKWKEAKHNW
ncbi:MAG: hypothetical protein HFH41_13095 [Lachnospiraceae bacterium]|nr:hypothetical protein [Lachnospiraceae bacterium]